MKEMSSATSNTTKQIALITKANKERADACAGIAGQMKDIRRITERNASGVKQTRGSTGDLVTQAQALDAHDGPDTAAPQRRQARRVRRPSLADPRRWLRPTTSASSRRTRRSSSPPGTTGWRRLPASPRERPSAARVADLLPDARDAVVS